MKYPVHISDSGSFQELIRAHEVEFGQLSILTVNPACKRGGHYHKRKREWFCCLHGECALILHGGGYKYRTRLHLLGSHREFIGVEPPVRHWIINSSNDQCELLIVSSEEYDPEEEDTYED